MREKLKKVTKKVKETFKGGSEEVPAVLVSVYKKSIAASILIAVIGTIIGITFLGSGGSPLAILFPLMVGGLLFAKAQYTMSSAKKHGVTVYEGKCVEHKAPILSVGKSSKNVGQMVFDCDGKLYSVFLSKGMTPIPIGHTAKIYTPHDATPFDQGGTLIIPNVLSIEYSGEKENTQG